MGKGVWRWKGCGVMGGGEGLKGMELSGMIKFKYIYEWSGYRLGVLMLIR